MGRSELDQVFDRSERLPVAAVGDADFDSGPSPLPPRDKAKVLQFLQGGPDGVAARAVLLAQLKLGRKQGTDLEAPLRDPLHEILRDLGISGLAHRSTS